MKQDLTKKAYEMPQAIISQLEADIIMTSVAGTDYIAPVGDDWFE